MRPDSSYWALVVPAHALTGIGLGIMFNSGSNTATLGLATSDTGIGAAVYSTFQQLGGATGTWYTHPQRAYERPTSEFNSHLAVHDDQVARRGVDFQAVIHAQPPYLVQLSHIRDIRTTREFNRRILRWEPETIVQLPAGIEVLDFMVPGSRTLMENNVRALRDHVIVLWSKHGIMVRSDASPLAAVDKVEYAETGAMYEVRNLMTGGLGQGVTDAELHAVVRAFDVPTDLF